MVAPVAVEGEPLTRGVPADEEFLVVRGVGQAPQLATGDVEDEEVVVIVRPGLAEERDLGAVGRVDRFAALGGEMALGAALQVERHRFGLALAVVDDRRQQGRAVGRERSGEVFEPLPHGQTRRCTPVARLIVQTAAVSRASMRVKARVWLSGAYIGASAPATLSSWVPLPSALATTIVPTPSKATSDPSGRQESGEKVSV